MEVKLKLEGRYWQTLLALLSRESYVYDVEIVKNDNVEAILPPLSKNDFTEDEEDYTVLPPEREALIHLSTWDDNSIKSIEETRLWANQILEKTW